MNAFSVPFAKGVGGDLAHASQRPGERGEVHRDDEHLLIGSLRERLERPHIFVGDQMVGRPRRSPTPPSPTADETGGGHLRFRRARSRGFRGAERGLPLALRFEHDRRLPPLGARDVRLPRALGFKDHRALLALGLHLPRHRVDEILGRLDVLDLDAGHLDAPWLGGCVDNAEQARG